MQQILNTPRLILRTIENNDFEEIHRKIFSNFNVVKNTFGSELFTLDETKDFLVKNANFNGSLGLSVIIEKQSNTILGLAGVLKCHYMDDNDYEIGFILQEESWGKGYASEIAMAQINQVKDELKRNRVLAASSPINKASIKTLESLGFTYEKNLETSRGERLIYVMELK